MSYCDDCILIDICGKEGCCDEAMAFCADKNKFIHVSTLDKIKAEIEQLRNFRAEDYDLEQYCDWFGARIIFRDDALEIINKYRKE